MNHARIIFMTIAILVIGAFVYADDPFQIGYEEGYKHGLNDKQTGMDFDYAHSYRYQEGISSNSYVNSQFREGYKDGYVEGYKSVNSGNSSRRITIYTNDDDRIYTSEGFATAFKSTGFSGSMRQFPVGRYSELDNDDWEDEIESIQVSGNVRVILFDREDFEGQSLILESDSFDLDELNFKRRAASMIVELQ